MFARLRAWGLTDVIASTRIDRPRLEGCTCDEAENCSHVRTFWGKSGAGSFPAQLDYAFASPSLVTARTRCDVVQTEAAQGHERPLPYRVRLPKPRLVEQPHLRERAGPPRNLAPLRRDPSLRARARFASPPEHPGSAQPVLASAIVCLVPSRNRAECPPRASTGRASSGQISFSYLGCRPPIQVVSPCARLSRRKPYRTPDHGCGALVSTARRPRWCIGDRLPDRRGAHRAGR